ncbi:phosphotyrosine interaction domain (PTB/PID) domain-containing protein [Ditylenchus destructor]|nr:phosphotyrosine interaction domain (PTB/PID) domain-containing protein [Ditylenchus destructor]
MNTREKSRSRHPTSGQQTNAPREFHRRDLATLEIEEAGAGVGGEYRNEREEEEYFYIQPRPLSQQSSESATIHFLTDDRELETQIRRDASASKNPAQWPKKATNGRSKAYEDYSTKERVIFDSQNAATSAADDRAAELGAAPSSRDPSAHHHRTSSERFRRRIEPWEQSQSRSPPSGRRGGQRLVPLSAVDYSPRDFRHSRAIIEEAAAKNNQKPAMHSAGDHSPASNVRVRQVGDTTIVTEHRDPYSFYWQLDQFKKKQEDPPRKPPPPDYVIDEEEEPERQETIVLSPDSHDSGVQVESHYSRPRKEEPVRQLPSGWEKHEDPTGFSYYWHVDSGTIQRDPPVISQRPTIPEQVAIPVNASQQTILLPPPSIPQQPIIEEHAFRQTTTKRRVENRDESSDNERAEFDGKKKRFMVRSLGWVEIPEEDLTAERSSTAVNRAIVELSATPSPRDNSQKWGNGKELIMELDDKELSLLDPDNMHVLNKHSIQQIRVWGVGKDNARDFAYVARDKNTRRFLCHVFRCDSPAKIIANSLRDICKSLMAQRRPASLHAFGTIPEKRITKESLLLTPIDEPKRVIRCHFIGVTQVPKATGIDVLNEAVDRLVNQVRLDRWVLVDVSIAPSTIIITELNTNNQIAQCRVRYLSFLGIGQDIKRCAFIMHTSSENFMCYVFHVEPSASALAKTIEAACKLRYQKVLDAHINRQNHSHAVRTSHHLNGFA